MLTGPRGARLRCRVALRWRERSAGLRGADRLAADEALLFPGATSVHTFGMRFPIVVARLDGSLRVVDLRTVAPRRLLSPMRRAQHVLECSMDVDLRVGDELVPAQAGHPPSPAAPVTIQDPPWSVIARFTPRDSPESRRA